MRKVLAGIITLIALSVHCQISGIVSVPGTYSTISSVISALNQNGIAGAVTVNIAAGYTETAISGGYTLYASGTASNPVTFRKSGTGSNPLIVAYVGNKTPGAAVQDGVWRFAGCDHITIDGIDIVDPNSTNPATMEFGYGFFKLNGIDGCQYNTVKNCVITLSRINNGGGAGPAADGSRGIDVVNATMAAHNTHVTVFSSDGSNSNNQFKNNIISNCNIGISLYGFAGTSPFLYCDSGNLAGDTGTGSGNQILNFGGGGTANAAAGIRAFAQYDFTVAGNSINNHDGAGVKHATTLRGIHLLDAPSANVSVTGNTLSLHSGASGSQLICILNLAGNAGMNNTVTITENVIRDCSYTTASSGSFYGIWNNAAAARLEISSNLFLNNSSGAASGSTYLIYNNAAVSEQIRIRNNILAMCYNGSSAYSGTMYGVNNTAAAPAASISISANRFTSFAHVKQQGTGNIYFINSSAACNQLRVDSNCWKHLRLNHSGNEYFIYNSSAVQYSLSVSSNTITDHVRSGAAANMYGYYSNVSVPATATQQLVHNLIAGITATVPGSGSFYGIYSGDGNNSPFPLKTISSNTVTGVEMNGSGNFYGIYAADLGDGGGGGGSVLSGNVVQQNVFSGQMYGLYCSSPVSPLYPASVINNNVTGLKGDGSSATVYGLYLSSNNSGVHCSGNKIAGIVSMGAAGTAHGLYGAATSTSAIYNNIIGHIEAPVSGGANRCNGIYISGGTFVDLAYNTVLIETTSTGLNFGTNALYVSSTAGLLLRNNILVNRSSPTGSGICAAYRRSTSTLTSYNAASDHNLFYSGVFSASKPLLYSGTSHQNLSALKSAVSPRESNSVSQDPVFRSLNYLSPHYLHLYASTVSVIESGAQNISLTSVDHNNETRAQNSGYTGSGTAPDIGADEFETDTSACNLTKAGLLFPASLNVCVGNTVSLFGMDYSAGTGNTQQIKMSQVAGGPYTTTVSQGTEFYSAPLSAGVYYFIMESSCASAPGTLVSAEATVVVRSVADPTLTAQSVTVCSGDSVSLSAQGVPGAEFSWLGPGGFFSEAPSAHISRADSGNSGQYVLQLSDNGCSSAAKSLTLSVAEVSITLSSSRRFLCVGDSAVLTALSSAGSYSWSNGAITSSVQVTPAVSSVYSVSASYLGCKVTASLQVSVTDPTISVSGATLCGNQSATVLTAQSFTPAETRWYSDPSLTQLLHVGNSYSLSAANSSTYYVLAQGVEYDSLITEYSGSDMAEGLMFDITALADLEIQNLSLHLPSAGVYTVELWHRTGSYNGFTNSPTGWLSAGTCTVHGSGTALPSLLPISPALNLSGGQTTGLYVSVSGGSLFCSSTGTNAGPWQSNNDILISSGNSGPYFGLLTPGGGFDGTIQYKRLLCSSPLKAVGLLLAPQPQVNIIATPSVVCPGSQVTLVASGADKYKWTGISGNSQVTVAPQQAMTYSVTGTSSLGCAGGATILVNTFSVPAVNVTASATLVCPSAPITLTANGGSSYVWNTGATAAITTVSPPLNTTYTVFGFSDQGCMASQTLAVATKSVPVVKINMSADSVCAGQIVVLSAQGANSYTWLPSYSTGPTFSLYPQFSGIYNVAGQSVNSCTQLAYVYVRVNDCTALPVQEETGYKVCPNPSAGIFQISFLVEAERNFEVYSSSGQLCFFWRSSDPVQRADLSDLLPGIYFLIVSEERHRHVVKLMLIE